MSTEDMSSNEDVAVSRCSDDNSKTYVNMVALAGDKGTRDNVAIFDDNARTMGDIL